MHGALLKQKTTGYSALFSQGWKVAIYNYDDYNHVIFRKELFPLL